MVITITGNIICADRKKVEKKLQAKIRSILKAHIGEKITICVPAPDDLQVVAHDAATRASIGFKVKKITATDGYKVMIQRGLSWKNAPFVEYGSYSANPLRKSKWIVEHSDVVIFYMETDLDYCGITYSYALGERRRTGKPEVHRIY